MSEVEKQTATENEQPQQRFEIQRIYLKDVSFEAPNTPKVFLEEWKPEISIDLHVDHQKVDEHLFEVTLSVTVSAKIKDDTAFLVEVKKAGIFVMSGFEKEQLDSMLGAFCPSILFPYVREVISDVVTRASFPQLLLSPVNFDAYYQQQKEKGETTKH